MPFGAKVMLCLKLHGCFYFFFNHSLHVAGLVVLVGLMLVPLLIALVNAFVSCFS
jgi:hypothetical protein